VKDVKITAPEFKSWNFLNILGLPANLKQVLLRVLTVRPILHEELSNLE
jgi:hypothetical protein